MSYITRCPACGTAFRVVPDQLKLSEGWVRCGNCQEVFDASASLQPWPASDLPLHDVAAPPSVAGPEVADDSAAPEIAPQPVVGGHGRGPLSPDDVEFEFDPDWMEPANPARDRDLTPQPAVASGGLPPLYPEYVPAHGLEAEPTPTSVAEPAHGLTPEWVPDEEATPPPDPFADFAPEPDSKPEPDPERDRERDRERELRADTLVRAPAEEVSPARAAGTGAQAGPDASPWEADQGYPAESLSFVRQAERRAFWRRPAVQAAQGVLALALLASLALYWVVVERDRLAAWQPTWQPALQALCRPLGCGLAPLREIESVLIDSTALRRRGEGRYVFDVTLRNTGRWPVAVPALELTLTDIADQVLVRRVFDASDWVGDSMVLAPGADLPVRLELSLEAPEARTMTGYRALLFYP